MYLKSTRIALVYKLLAAAMAALGIYLNSGIPKGAFNPSVFLYFTIQSNVLCLAAFLIGAWRSAKGLRAAAPAPEANMRLKGGAILAITTTLLIYWLVLANVQFAMEQKPDPLANLMVHLVTPVLMLLDWALFERKGRVRGTDPLWWALAPFGYYLFTLAASALGARYMAGSHYPYFFIDATVLGWPRTLRNVLLVAVGFVALGYAFYALDRGLGRLAARARSR